MTLRVAGWLRGGPRLAPRSRRLDVASGVPRLTSPTLSRPRRLDLALSIFRGVSVRSPVLREMGTRCSPAFSGIRLLPPQAFTCAPEFKNFSLPSLKAFTSYSASTSHPACTGIRSLPPPAFARVGPLSPPTFACALLFPGARRLNMTPGSRELNIFSVFSAEQRERAKERLREEIGRGYFDEFKELRTTQGKVEVSSEGLLPGQGAAVMPPMEAFRPDGERLLLPLPEPRLLFVSFRAGSQAMIDSWLSEILTTEGRQKVPPMLQLSLVESWALSLRLLRPLVLRMLHPPKWPLEGVPSRGGNPQPQPHNPVGGEHKIGDSTSRHITGADVSSSTDGIDSRSRDALPSSHAPEVLFASQRPSFMFSFGDTWSFRKALRIRNRLSAYVLLLDGKGRVRWRGTGLPSDEDVRNLLHACDQLSQNC